MRPAKLLMCVFVLGTLFPGLEARAQESSFELALNNIEQVQSGCRVVFIAKNRLGTRLDKTAIEIAVFDAKNIFSGMVVFDFGRLPNGKTKVVQYDLPRECATISRLLLNSVKECAGEKDMRQECEDRIITSSRAKVEFGQ